MAYFCKTSVDGLGGRSSLGISHNVVDTLGRLSSEAERPTRPGLYGDEEWAWLEATVKEILRRLGQVAAGIPPSPLTTADLPDL